MVRIRLSTLVAAAMICAAGAAPAQQTVVEIPVTAAFTQNTLNWDASMGGVDLAWAVLDIGGVAHVCGATSATSSFAHRNTRTAFRKAWIKVNDRKVLTDLSYFNRTPRKTDLTTAKARCKPLAGVSGQGGQFLLGFDPVWVRD